MYATRRDTLSAGDGGRDPRRKRRIATFGTISALSAVLIGTVGVPQASAQTPMYPDGGQALRAGGTLLGAAGGGIACVVGRSVGTCVADAGAWTSFAGQMWSYPTAMHPASCTTFRGARFNCK